MKTLTMGTSRAPAARCQEIRGQLRDFAADRLDPSAAGPVRGHLLSCQACSEVFGDLLMEDVESGAIPLLAPPHIPPVEWYDGYMQAGSGRFGTFWKAVRDGLQANDEGLREWARAARGEIKRTFDAVANPDWTTDAVRARATGGGRNTGHRKKPSAAIAAQVVLRDGPPPADVVRFNVEEPARITSEGHFAMTLTTDEAGHDGDLVICTVTQPGCATVSFAGTIRRRVGEPAVREVRIDDAGVPGPADAVAPDRLELAVLST